MEKNREVSLTELGHRFEQPQEKLLAGLGYAARLFPPVAESLKSKRPTQLALDTRRRLHLSARDRPAAGRRRVWRPRPALVEQEGRTAGREGEDEIQKGKGRRAWGKMTMENLVAYQWELSLGETDLTEEEFRALAKLKTPLVQIRGQWVTLDSEQIEAAIRFWDKQQLEGEMALLEAMQTWPGRQNHAGGLPIEAGRIR